VRLAHQCFGKSPVSFIDHEVSRGRLLAPENLALQHLLSIPQYWQGALSLGMVMMTTNHHSSRDLTSRSQRATLRDERAEEGVLATQSDTVEVADDGTVRLP
jgi:hypothetical protein